MGPQPSSQRMASDSLRPWLPQTRSSFGLVLSHSVHRVPLSASPRSSMHSMAQVQEKDQKVAGVEVVEAIHFRSSPAAFFFFFLLLFIHSFPVASSLS